MGKYKVKLILTLCPYCGTQIISNVIIGMQHVINCTKCKKDFYTKCIGERIITEKPKGQI